MSDNSPQNHDQPTGPRSRRPRPCRGGAPARAALRGGGGPAAPPRGLAHAGPRPRGPRRSQLQSSLATMSAQNERLVRTLKDAREQIVTLKAEVDRLAQPPSAYGLVLESYDDGTVDILTGGRKMRVAVSPSVDPTELCARPGGHAQRGAQRRRRLRLRAGRRGRHAQGDARRRPGPRGRPRRRGAGLPAWPSASRASRSGSATRCMLDTRSGFVYERIPKAEVEDLVLEEVPGHRLRGHRRPGRADRADPRRGRAAVPAPRPVQRAPAEAAEGRPALRPARLRQDADRQGGGRVPGQEGRRADRASRSASRYFLNIKGPELLNKYVGETERHIRLIFQRAREKASDGTPVVVFFDEMDSLFRTRGSGVSTDVETTIVPQLLAEIDGVERLENVIVIGASNREDMIDPAILRPGRLDVKIKIERPDAESARDIFSKYLTADLPLHEHDLAEHGGVRQAHGRGDDPGRPSSGCTPRSTRTGSSRSPTPTATRRSCTSRTSTPAR